MASVMADASTLGYEHSSPGVFIQRWTECRFRQIVQIVESVLPGQVSVRSEQTLMESEAAECKDAVEFE